MVNATAEDQSERPVVLCEPLEPNEWNEFLEAIGDGLRSGEISKEDVAGIIQREKELM